MRDQVDRRTVLGGLVAGWSAAPVGLRAQPSNPPGGLAATYMRTEWLVDPVGIDADRPRLSWEIAANGRSRRQSACRVLIASSPALLAARRGDVWDSGRIAADRPAARPDRTLRLAPHQRVWWTVMLWDERGAPGPWGAAATFVTGLRPGDWTGRWIAAAPDAADPPHVRGADPRTDADTRLPILRRDFTCAAVPARALVSVVGLGQYELRINGAPVTAGLLNPGWTDYARTVLYDTYDVTALVRPGENRLGVLLGNGMYDVEREPGRYTKFVDRFGRPKLLLQLTLVGPDGAVDQIVSDDSWRVRPGPITFSSIYGGEDVDARLDLEGWDRPGVDGADWQPALAVTGPGGTLRASGTPPITVARTLETVAVTHVGGTAVYDFGENIAGRPELEASGPAGARLVITPGEALGGDGLPSQRSYNARPDRAVTFSYVFAGRGRERFVPRFTYQGFRYLAVTADPGIEVTSLRSQFIHADAPRVGTFTSGDRLFERIHAMIDRSVLSNMMSVLTDCPHREKLGWLEQTYLGAPTVMLNRDVATLYEKLVRDIADAQRADGMVPGIAPEYVAFKNADGSDAIYRDSPEWGIAAVLSPWEAYRNYGDREVLARGYPAMGRYLDYLAGRARGGVVDFGMGDWYDIGPKDPGPSQLTSRALTGTLVWYQGLVTAARVADVLGRPAAERAVLRRRADTVARAFLARFARGDGLFDTGSQTAQAMPLALGVVAPAERGAALDRLVAAIRATRGGVTAGDIGFRYVVDALSAAGRDDVLFDMMSVTDRPSYGYQLAHGATALAESWDANPTKSLNHFMLGHGEGWLYRSLAGVRIDFSRPRERVITLAPRPVGTVASAGATFRSVLGPVGCRWQRKGGTLTLDVQVPSGASATVIVPTGRPAAVREGGRPVTHAPDLRVDGVDARGLTLVVGSGDYRFTAPA